MIAIRRAADRGLTKMDWLESRHSFSFSHYFDPAHMGFHTLRVLNDDIVRGGAGFPRHPHRDMEIISWVLSGELAHEDSTGARAVLKPGNVQHMSAGSGIVHSEFNHSPSAPVHFLQIWIEPNVRGAAPRFQDFPLTPEDVANRLRLIASPDGRDGSAVLRQDASVYIGAFTAGHEETLPIPAGRHAWVQLATGEADLNGHRLTAGDGAAVSDELAIRLRANANSDILLFELP